MRPRRQSTNGIFSERGMCAGRPARLVACLGLALLFAIQSGIATVVRPLNLEQLTDHAGRIFSGRVVDVREERDPALGLMVSRITFAVTRAAKGDLHGRLTITTLAGQDRGGDLASAGKTGDRAVPQRRPRAGIRGMPVFRKGEEVVLFLYDDSSAGLTSPVGLGQGKLPIVEDKNGRPLAVGAGPPGRLFKDLSAQATARLGAHLKRWRKSGAIPPDRLLDMVDALLGRSVPAGGKP